MRFCVEKVRRDNGAGLNYTVTGHLIRNLPDVTHSQKVRVSTDYSVHSSRLSQFSESSVVNKAGIWSGWGVEWCHNQEPRVYDQFWQYWHSSPVDGDESMALHTNSDIAAVWHLTLTTQIIEQVGQSSACVCVWGGCLCGCETLCMCMFVRGGSVCVRETLKVVSSLLFRKRTFIVPVTCW